MMDAGMGKARRISQDAPSSHNQTYNNMDLTDIMRKLERIEAIATLGAKNVLRVEDVALLMGVTVDYVRRLTCNGTIPHYKPNKIIFFDKGEVEAWLKRNRVATREEHEQQALAYAVRKDMGLK